MIAVLEAPAKCTQCGKELSVGQRARVYGERVYGEGCHAVPLDGNLWQEALKVANRFRYKADPEDRDDLVQNIILKCAEVARKRDGLTEASLWVIARHVVFRYWRDRAKKPLSLNAPVLDTEEAIEIWETLEDKSADLDAWLEARSRLGELPTGILRIARKLERGDPLTRGQRARLARFRQDGDSNPNSAWSRKRYRKLRARGLCPTCGKESSGAVRCPGCREKARAGQARYRRRKGRAWQRALRACWRKQGRCPRCGKPPESGRKTCPCCLAKNREHLRQWRRQAAFGQQPAGEDRTLGETIAARDVDLDGLLDMKEWLKGCPPAILRIARKKFNGERLTQQEHDYWWKYRRRRGAGPARPKHLLDPFAGAIKDMMGKGWEPHRMLEELRAQGYRGSLSTLYSYLQRLKVAVPCPQCGCLFTPSKAHTKYCSSECQRKRVRRAHQDYINRRYHQDPAFRARKLERGRRQRARRGALA